MAVGGAVRRTLCGLHTGLPALYLFPDAWFDTQGCVFQVCSFGAYAYPNCLILLPSGTRKIVPDGLSGCKNEESPSAFYFAIAEVRVWLLGNGTGGTIMAAVRAHNLVDRDFDSLPLPVICHRYICAVPSCMCEYVYACMHKCAVRHAKHVCACVY